MFATKDNLQVVMVWKKFDDTTVEEVLTAARRIGVTGTLRKTR